MVKISQSDILEFLKKNKDEWYSTSQIRNKLRFNPINCLERLRKFRLVEWKIRGYNNNEYFYNYKKTK